MTRPAMASAGRDGRQDGGTSYQHFSVGEWDNPVAAC